MGLLQFRATLCGILYLLWYEHASLELALVRTATCPYQAPELAWSSKIDVPL